MGKSQVVLIQGNVAGTLLQHDDGRLGFTYADGYAGPSLSIHMPYSDREYGDKQVRPYLLGLLPDSLFVRTSVAREFGVSPNNPFDLLEHIGLDCPGAVQFCPEERVDDVTAREQALRPVGYEEIALRLREGRREGDGPWVSSGEHWSLGGAQSKFALRRENGEWYSCRGAAATTHILKPGIGRLKRQALNEFVCMKLAAACGLDVAGVEYELFGDEPAIVVERYDRVRRDDGVVMRLHQEDLCQALAVLPERKYADDGGPSTGDVIGLLKDTGADSGENIELFLQMLFFNYLVGGTDAHAKNYSLILGRSGEAVLAPMYDVASVLPYRDPRQTYRLAMGIGGENRLGRLRRSGLERLVEGNGLAEWGLDVDVLVRVFTGLAGLVADKLDGVLSAHGAIPGMDELAERFAQPLRRHCERAVGAME